MLIVRITSPLRPLKVTMPSVPSVRLISGTARTRLGQCRNIQSSAGLSSKNHR